jgi:8-oxo-dGTP diphosphatase
MEKQKPGVAVNILVVRDGQILLGRRKGKVGDGFWGVPGGRLEFFESLVNCAKRELEEETGLKADKLTFLHMINDPRPNDDKSHYIHIEFLAENVLGEPQLREPEKCSEWKWFDINNLPKDIFLGHQRSIPALLEKAIVVDDGKTIL